MPDIGDRGAALPITSVLPALHSRLAERHELVLEAPPGAGKTTVVPLALLESGWLGDRRILMLEPRRMAARAAAERMAALLGERTGDTVGYRVRQETRVSARTRVEVVTEGILTRMLQSDPALEAFGLLIFDEFHERSLDSDLGLALTLQARELFRTADQPLRILLMSATLDGAAVADLLGGAPLLRCEGRMYPVEMHYLAANPAQDAMVETVVATLRGLLTRPVAETGGILVFLPGQAEIHRVAKMLPVYPDTAVIALHGGLSLAEQRRAIEPAPEGARKVVLATNIAETSLTIDGITTVVDGGLTREPHYDPASGMTRLRTRRLSRASSVQRAGRAGRLGPGRCYRMWSEEQQQRLAPESTPEILQADLTPLALQLAAWGVNDPHELRWLDPPPHGPYACALELLRDIGALAPTENSRWQLTEAGRKMASMPMHPRLARMLLRADAGGLAKIASEIAAILGEHGAPRTDTADVLEQLAMVRGDTPCPPAYRGWLSRVREQARLFRRHCTAVSGAAGDDIASAGILLALAYPDRIARRRAGRTAAYQLSNGRTGVLDESDPLRAAEWLAVADVGGRSGSAEDRIHLGTALSPTALLRELPDLVRTRELVEWDDRQERFVAQRQQLIGSLVVSTEPLEAIDAERKTAALCALLQRRGIGLLPWNDELRQWQARVMLLHAAWAMEQINPWPDVSDAALLATLPEWLEPWLHGVDRLTDFRKLDLRSILAALLPWPLAKQLDELAPIRLRVPSGSNIAIDYRRSPPVLSVKLQEMFGCATTPTIANGRVKLVLHLLSPAGRPLQVTQDLGGFWQSSYQDVKKEMKGRYPKHPWPEDPLKAAPTRHTKARSACAGRGH